jgi:LPXTG-motif cell wall-anchored protein
MGPGNQTLVNNVFNWLVDREELVGIPPKRPEQVRLSMTKAQSDWAMLLVLVGLPALAIAAGFWVWARRRRVR